MSPPSWQYWPDVGTGNDYSDAWVVGGGYGIVPHTQGSTLDYTLDSAGTSGITKIAHLTWAGTSGTVSDPTVLGLANNVVPGVVFPANTEFKYLMRSGYGESSPAYNFMAVSQNIGSSNPVVFGEANADGWIICAREASIGTMYANGAAWLPIDGTSNVTGSGTFDYTSTAYGMGDKWSNTANASSLVFFMSSYNIGDCHTWSNWDGVSTP